MLSSESTATVTWKIPEGTEEGTYMIWNYGDYKHLTGGTVPFTGHSSKLLCAVSPSVCLLAAYVCLCAPVWLSLPSAVSVRVCLSLCLINSCAITKTYEQPRSSIELQVLPMGVICHQACQSALSQRSWMHGKHPLASTMHRVFAMHPPASVMLHKNSSMPTSVPHMRHVDASCIGHLSCPLPNDVQSGIVHGSSPQHMPQCLTCEDTPANSRYCCRYLHHWSAAIGVSEGSEPVKEEVRMDCFVKQSCDCC